MFTTDNRAEKWLDLLGARWRYSNDAKFNDMSPVWDEMNLGRSEVKIAKAIEEYGRKMDLGSAAPAPILWMGPDGLEVLDGLQRCLAIELRKTMSFSASIVETAYTVMMQKIRICA